MTNAREVIANTKHRAFSPYGVDAKARGVSVETRLGTTVADAIIAALSAAGLVIVPKEPTEKMRWAGWHQHRSPRLRCHCARRLSGVRDPLFAA